MIELNIGIETKNDIERLIKFAHANIIKLDDMKLIAAGEKSPVGDDSNYSCNISDNIRVVFSIEEHPKFYARHISISENGRIPENSLLIQLIIESFEFKKPLHECYIYPEEYENNSSVNILEEYALKFE